MNCMRGSTFDRTHAPGDLAVLALDLEVTSASLSTATIREIALVHPDNSRALWMTVSGRVSRADTLKQLYLVVHGLQSQPPLPDEVQRPSGQLTGVVVAMWNAIWDCDVLLRESMISGIPLLDCWVIDLLFASTLSPDPEPISTPVRQNSARRDPYIPRCDRLHNLSMSPYTYASISKFVCGSSQIRGPQYGP